MLIMLGLLVSFCSFSNVIISGTRVIYPSDAKSVTVKITNEGVSPSLVQSWIDDGDVNENPALSKAPFLITPPIIRVEPQKGQDLKLVFTGNELPNNKESVFWLNVLDIPPKESSATGNQLSLAIKSRLKLFYRPASLKQPTESDYKNIKFKIDKNTLIVKNESPYFISIVNINKNIQVDPFMVYPFSETSIISKTSISNAKELSYTIVDDYGANRVYRMKID